MNKFSFSLLAILMGAASSSAEIVLSEDFNKFTHGSEHRCIFPDCGIGNRTECKRKGTCKSGNGLCIGYDPRPVQKRSGVSRCDGHHCV